MIHLVLLLVLHGTAPAFESDTSFGAGCMTASVHPERTAAVDVYRALVGGDGTPIFQFAIPCLAGAPFSFDAGTLPATWWAVGVDSAGNVGDLNCARGYTANVPTVSVEQANDLAHLGQVYELTGARAHEVLRSGVYFVRTGLVNRVLVVRR